MSTPQQHEQEWKVADHILAIDQGTTGTRVLVINVDGEVVGEAYSELRQYYPRPGWVEHDPQEIWTVSRDVAARAIAEAGIASSDLVALGVTNQRETTVVWDRETGVPVHNAVVWQDRRTADICDRLRAEGLEELFRTKTGLVVDAYFSGRKLSWLLDNVEGLRGRAEAGELAFGTIDAWLLWKLTGGRVHATDYSNASRTLLYDIYDLTWDEELLGVLGVPPELLPAVHPSSHVYAETDPEAFFDATVPIAGIAGDQQAALFAQACYSEGLAKNTYGTGSFVLMNVGTQPQRVTEG
ncbi:MAG: FGGY family carbohydrate kinase, partial [Actinomycetota bacterium]|nr:FGGY family carbohydrate kinase [Actinomycetota bacterium]